MGRLRSLRGADTIVCHGNLGKERGFHRFSGHQTVEAWLSQANVSVVDSLPHSLPSNQPLLSKIPNRYRNSCQVLDQDSGQAAGLKGGVSGIDGKIQAEAMKGSVWIPCPGTLFTTLDSPCIIPQS